MRKHAQRFYFINVDMAVTQPLSMMEFQININDVVINLNLKEC